jgi:hypothetical protein
MKENLFLKDFWRWRNNEGSISEPFKGQFLASLSNQSKKAQDLASSLQTIRKSHRGRCRYASYKMR